MKSSIDFRANSHLPAANAKTDSIDEPWTGSNEQWWNWYISLADNSQEPVNRERLIPRPEEVAQKVPSIEELQKELAEPYPISEHQIKKFQTESYLRIKNLLSPGSVYLLRQELKQVFDQHYKFDPNRQFSSREMMWLESDIAKEFVLSRRLGQLAAQLLQVSSVRIYHDDFLCKEPGGGRTPWHYDGHHYPIASNNVGTMWIPLQPTPKEMGPLELAKGMDTYKLVKEIPFDKFSQDHDRAIAEMLQARGIIIDREPFQLGEITFQHSLNVHGAGANCTTEQRIAFGISYFENGASVINSPTLISGDWQKFMPGVQPSEPISSPYNPIVYDT
ncbi:MAG: phytanoyl-CoA dioxygenase family protein [Moorea sp. SIOASIH]|uniref:phytanoyl-CoA dioxygenase family protein n=1 Tax=Moorena sp. SIOASIH TaxID=2607817 RepID=UPI0013BA023E|nr:phytanoyl-CoA dioxygenase family protein [Moorena sp. SIOASIH]NEO40048.1 phytanoyl-CoA dioxygenase family protein [Moorena sp. SIOASIH]NEO89544.1 phytanoyl-CoA dioxygenase family protein [Moorena sp. SIO3G5]